MMTHMIFQGILIVDSQNILVAIGNDYHLFARLDAFLCASRARCASHLGVALGVCNVAVDGSGLAHIIDSQSRKGRDK
jgi:hypothetical protein